MYVCSPCSNLQSSFLRRAFHQGNRTDLTFRLSRNSQGSFYSSFQKSVSYSGTNHRLRRVIRRALAGEPLVIAALGGSGESMSLSSRPNKQTADGLSFLIFCFHFLLPQLPLGIIFLCGSVRSTPTMPCSVDGSKKSSRMRTIAFTACESRAPLASR